MTQEQVKRREREVHLVLHHEDRSLRTSRIIRLGAWNIVPGLHLLFFLASLEIVQLVEGLVELSFVLLNFLLVFVSLFLQLKLGQLPRQPPLLLLQILLSLEMVLSDGFLFGENPATVLVQVSQMPEFHLILGDLVVLVVQMTVESGYNVILLRAFGLLVLNEGRGDCVFRGVGEAAVQAFQRCPHVVEHVHVEAG